MFDVDVVVRFCCVCVFEWDNKRGLFVIGDCDLIGLGFVCVIGDGDGVCLFFLSLIGVCKGSCVFLFDIFMCVFVVLVEMSKVLILVMLNLMVNFFLVFVSSEILCVCVFF